MAEFSALPLWTDAFLADTTHLDALETGAYLLLLMASWRTEDGGLPNDDKVLRRYAKVTPQQWPHIKKTVLGFFDVRNDGLLIQKRLEKERDFVRTRKSAQSALGVKGAEARWLKHKESLLPDALPKQSKGNAQRMPEPSQTDAVAMATSIAPATATASVPTRKKELEESSSEAARENDPEEPVGADAEDDAPPPIPAFLIRQGVKPMRAQPIDPNWQPSADAQQRLMKSRPDLSVERMVERTNEFKHWCAEGNRLTHNPDATWLKFMEKTHVKQRGSNDDGSTPASRGIAAAFARRSISTD